MTWTSELMTWAVPGLTWTLAFISYLTLHAVERRRKRNGRFHTGQRDGGELDLPSRPSSADLGYPRPQYSRHDESRLAPIRSAAFQRDGRPLARDMR
jgi:hypothetical protein